VVLPAESTSATRFPMMEKSVIAFNIHCVSKISSEARDPYSLTST
jgi:hypothetical protein